MGDRGVVYRRGYGGGDEFGKKLKNEQIIEIYQEIRKQTEQVAGI